MVSMESSQRRLINVIIGKPELWEPTRSRILLDGVAFRNAQFSRTTDGPIYTVEFLHKRYVVATWEFLPLRDGTSFIVEIEYFVGTYGGFMYKTILSVISSLRSSSGKGKFAHLISTGKLDLGECLTIPILASYMVQLKHDRKAPLDPLVMEIATTGDEELDEWIADKLEHLSGPMEGLVMETTATELPEVLEVPEVPEITGPVRIIRI